MKNIPLFRALALVLTLTSTALHAQVPQILNYQGRVAVGDPPVNFDGSGAFKFALVDGSGATSFWSNDDTSSAGSEPTAAVPLPVTKGLYSVLLGANMTPIPPTVFANEDVWLRVWFDDGTANGSQLLTPDQRIAAVGYAMVASTLQSGATISSSTDAPAASFANFTDNPAAIQLSTQWRSWWLGQNKAPDATSLFDQFYIYDGSANATRLRIDTDGVIHGNGSGLTGVAASGLAPDATIPASALTGTIPASQVATPPPGMALIPAGEFTMGDSLDGVAAPVSTTVSAFYMDLTEVTLSQWQTVQQWGTLLGDYTDLPAGSGKGADYPVSGVSWYDCVKWCNARSEREGKTPVYYTNNDQTQVYRTGDTDVTNEQVKWDANGYRLPTEAEWEKAARGGLSGKRFPWGDTISQKQANYYGETGSATYDLGPDGFNAIGSVGGTTPATSPVGSFAANGYGLHDMAGNVFEWCWDWYGTPYAGGTDPKGPDTGEDLRVARGGSYGDFITPSNIYTRCAQRFNTFPYETPIDFGFRVVVPAGQP